MHVPLSQVYGLPFGITKHFQARFGDPLRAKLSGASGPVLPKWRAAKRSVARAVTCCGFIGPVHEEKDLTVSACQQLDWGHTVHDFRIFDNQARLLMTRGSLDYK